jgi:outer membrane protein assembly factor BamB
MARLPRLSSILVAALVALTVLASSARGQEWTRFRGPNGSGISPAGSMPVQWTEKDYRWNVTPGGTGFGCPVLWGQRVFLLSADEKAATRIVQCLDADDGKALWAKSYPVAAARHHTDNSLAASTPAVDKDRVYVCLAARQATLLLALDHKGEEIWRRDLGPQKGEHGPCITPIVWEDLVIVANDQEGPSSVLAVESATGKTAWQTPRKSGKTTYGTPCVYQPAERPQGPAGGAAQIVVTSTAEGVTGLNARTGKVEWSVGDAFPERCVGSPVVAGDLIVACCGVGSSGVRMVAVRPGRQGEPAAVAWDRKSSIPYVPTPLYRDGLVMLLGDSGGVWCLRAAAGEEVWQDKLPDKFYGSLVCADGRLYCISRVGKVYVLSAGEKFSLLATQDLGDKCHSTPAVAGGRMYFRTFSHLFCLGGKK